jgi:hypothetical protein
MCVCVCVCAVYKQIFLTMIKHELHFFPSSRHLLAYGRFRREGFRTGKTLLKLWIALSTETNTVIPTHVTFNRC